MTDSTPKDFSVAELEAKAREFLDVTGIDASESLDWFFRSLDPNKRYTIDDLKNVLALFGSEEEL